MSTPTRQVVAQRLTVTGVVQGVGFRVSAQEAAWRLDLHGWVRNLRDGRRLEVVVEGDHLSNRDQARIEELARRYPQIINFTNPVGWDGGPVWSPPPEGSNSAALAAALPGARVVKAFNTFGAEFHADPSLPGGPADVQIAGDDDAARQQVAAIAERSGFTPVDAGPLRNAALLESLAVLWIHLATVGGRGRNAAFRLISRG